MTERPPEPVQLPHHQDVTELQFLQRLLELGPGFGGSGTRNLVSIDGFTPSRLECFHLEVEVLVLSRNLAYPSFIKHHPYARCRVLILHN